MPWLDDLKRLRVRVDNEGYGKQMAEVAGTGGRCWKNTPPI